MKGYLIAAVALVAVALACVLISPPETAPDPAPLPAVQPMPTPPSPPTKPKKPKCPNCPQDLEEIGFEAEAREQGLSMDLPLKLRQACHNPDGSCVQCSISMCGYDQNVPAASMLLWDTDYGKAERGGSEPGRVGRYMQARGMRGYNVTGSNTYDWMRWACATGRGAAVGCSSSHFQTLAGYDPAGQRWAIIDNNGNHATKWYSDQQFRQLHEASGRWCVILDYPPHPARPVYREWWK